MTHERSYQIEQNQRYEKQIEQLKDELKNAKEENKNLRQIIHEAYLDSKPEDIENHINNRLQKLQ